MMVMLSTIIVDYFLVLRSNLVVALVVVVLDSVPGSNSWWLLVDVDRLQE